MCTLSNKKREKFLKLGKNKWLLFCIILIFILANFVFFCLFLVLLMCASIYGIYQRGKWSYRSEFKFWLNLLRSVHDNDVAKSMNPSPKLWIKKHARPYCLVLGDSNLEVKLWILNQLKRNRLHQAILSWMQTIQLYCSIWGAS